MFSEGIQQVVGFKDGWEVVDLNHVTKLFRIEVDVQALVQSVVVLGVLNGDVVGLVHVGLDLRAAPGKQNVDETQEIQHTAKRK